MISAKRPLSYAAASLLCLSGLTLLLAQGCKAPGVGDPCVPEQEYNPAFNGFDKNEVNVESKSFQCQTRLCLVNHFQGRVTCPYGQDDSGNANFPSSQNPLAQKACSLPGSTDPVTGGAAGKKVAKQCIGRVPSRAVYCSCRCANADGKTDDGANYCQCPEKFTCEQLVNPLPGQDAQLAGAYCIPDNTKFKAADCDGECNPDIADSAKACGSGT